MIDWLKIDDRKNLIFLADKFNRITYGSAAEIVDFYSKRLEEAGIKEKMHVGIISNNNIYFPLLILALWKLNTVVIPINNRLKRTEINDIISLSDINFIIKVNNLESDFSFNNIPFKIIPISSVEPKKINNLALIILTSGTSNKPKAVMHSYYSLFAAAKISNSFIKQNEGDKWLASLPFFHIGGFSIIIRSLIFGCSLIIPPDLTSEEMLYSINYFKPNYISLVSTLFNRLLENGLDLYPELKFLFLGGGPINYDLYNELIEKDWPLSVVYGSSETAAMISAANISEMKAKKGTVGKPFINVTLKVIDSFNQVLEANSRGLLSVYYPGLFLGYYPKQNNLNDFFNTGDWGYVDNDGYLFIESRRTDLILSGGENINPVEVENELVLIDGIDDACVFPVDNDQWGQMVCAALVTNEPVDEEYIKNRLKLNLAGFKIPKKIIRVNEIPRNSMNKILRNKAKELFSQMIS